MNNKVAIPIIVVTVIILAGLAWWYFSNQTDNVVQPSKDNAKGRVIFGITDLAAQMDSINAVEMTINKIEVKGKNENWVSVTATEQTFNLLDLKNKDQIKLLAQADLDVGEYSAIKLNISKIVVVENGVRKEAVLPSDEMNIDINFEAKAKEIVAVTFDFMADKMIHKAAGGEFVAAPVVKIEYKAQPVVRLLLNSEITIEGGQTLSQVEVGMNAEGQTGQGLKIDAGVGLIIEDGEIRVLEISSEDAFNLALGQNIVVSSSLSMEGGEWVIIGIDSATNELVKITIDGQTGTVVKTDINNQQCQANCQSQCAGSVLAGCQSQCKENGVAQCQAAAQINCEASCQASLSATCQLGCKTSAKIECAAQCSGDLLNQSSCMANCEAEKTSACTTNCVSSGKGQCLANCVASAGAQCAANLDTACQGQCLLSSEFRSCYSTCTADCK